jgi:GNAT superfamily N-acetyltransferase
MRALRRRTASRLDPLLASGGQSAGFGALTRACAIPWQRRRLAACLDRVLDVHHYRFATLDDCNLIARLNRALIDEGADVGPTDLESLHRRVLAGMVSGKQRVVLFEDEGDRLLAYALFEESADEIYLSQFLVVRRARRCGIGRRAVEMLRSTIWSPRKRLTLEVLSGNRGAQRFWRSLGYRDFAVTLELPAPQMVCKRDVAA